MIFRISSALVLWHVLASAAGAQLRDAKVSQPTRLDWEFAAQGFGRDPAGDLPADYDSKRQKYQLYVPFTYTTTQNWPLIAFISPEPRPVGWASFEQICVNEGIFFCCPYNAHNKTPAGQRIRIVLDMVDDVRRKYRIDPNQTYIGGFSGGGRIACSVGFSLPEVFAGVLPVCGTNPLKSLPYLRHRIVDRVSVAFVTGAGDFNRKENEEWMAPYLKELGIRTNLWVVPGMGHNIPHAGVMGEVVNWLAADLKRRQEDARSQPQLNLKFDEGLRGDAQADRLLAAARRDVEDKERVWKGVALLQAITKRWPDSQAAGSAGELMQKIKSDEQLVKALDDLRLADDSEAFSAQARELERAGNIPKAIEVWDVLAHNHRDAPIAEKARSEVQRLQNLEVPARVEPRRRK